ncbi:MAG: U32 family peptidase, partial [Clostridia bacterium]|nr:U32 family peptidase [Clostridia bacterium]
MPLYLPELLCPAGDESAFRAAIDCGANAVYLGYKALGARASAVNFDDEALERAVSYAHLHHARVHVTVNTLIKQHELQGVYDALKSIEAAGADAVIVQDAGVAAMVKRDFPKLHMHASTQMAICNAEGARMAQAMGFDRAVLARECGLDDIRKACETGIEIEVFGHGALCTAVSGRCLMSSMSGGRSGNRGRCAQPCRQLLSMNGQEGPLLSLRDLCLLDDLPALCDAGVASLKIEGRLKSAEYVATVATVYRKALDAIAKGNFRPGDKREKEKLLQIYNRGGFTRGHAMGAEDADIITPERVSHEGLPIGEIISVRRDLAQMRVTRDLHDGDSLQLRGAKDEDMRYSGHDVLAGDMATLRLRPGLRVTPGMPVARLSDAVQLEEARAHAPAPIPVTMMARFAIGQPMILSISDGQTSVTAHGPIVEAAKNRASAIDDARRQLEKLGGTPFALAAPAQAIVDEGVFLPVGALNALRRDAVDKLTEARIAAFSHPADKRPDDFHLTRRTCADIGKETLAVLFSDITLAQQLTDAGATLLVYAPLVFTPDALETSLGLLPKGAWLRLPPQLTQETLTAVLPVIQKYTGRLGGLLAENIGQLRL